MYSLFPKVLRQYYSTFAEKIIVLLRNNTHLWWSAQKIRELPEFLTIEVSELHKNINKMLK